MSFEKERALTLTLLAVGGGLAAGCGSDKDNPVNPGIAPAALDQAKDLCATDQLNRGEYRKAVGNELVGNIGEQATNGALKLDDDPIKASEKAAEQVAENPAAQATIFTIISGEQGLDPSDVESKSNDTLANMEGDKDEATRICESVVGRMLATPKRYGFRSATGKVTIFGPRYRDGSLAAIDGKTTNNTKKVEVFGIEPLAGSDNEDLDEAVSDSWGVDATGTLVAEASKDNMGSGKKKSQEGSSGDDRADGPSGDNNTRAKGGAKQPQDHKAKGGARRDQQNDQTGGGGSKNKKKKTGNDGGEPEGQDDGCKGTGSPKCQGEGPSPGGDTTPDKKPPAVTPPPAVSPPPAVTPPPPVAPPPVAPPPPPPPGGGEDDDDKGGEPPANCQSNPFDPRC